MKNLSAAAALCTTLLAAGAARADTTYTVDKITVTGSKTVPTQTILDGLNMHKGSHVTQADIVAGQDDVGNVLKKANVVGSIKTSMRALPKNHVEVIYAIDDQGAQAPVVNHVLPKLHAEIFAGNKVLTTDQLRIAAGLTPGQELSNDKIAAAQKAIIAAYAAAKKPVDVQVSGAISPMSQGQTDITWNIVETKSKAKKKDSRSQDAQDEIAPP